MYLRWGGGGGGGGFGPPRMLRAFRWVQNKRGFKGYPKGLDQKGWRPRGAGPVNSPVQGGIHEFGVGGWGGGGGGLQCPPLPLAA